MKIFAGEDFFRYTNNLKIKLVSDVEKEIESGKEEKEIKDILLKKYTLPILEIGEEPIEIPRPRRETIQKRSNFLDEIYRAEVNIFDIPLKIKGIKDLFEIRPTVYTLHSEEISIDEYKQILYFELIIESKDSEQFKKQLESKIEHIRINLPNINKDIEDWNHSLSSLLDEEYLRKKKSFDEEQKFYQDIGVNK